MKRTILVASVGLAMLATIASAQQPPSLPSAQEIEISLKAVQDSQAEASEKALGEANFSKALDAIKRRDVLLGSTRDYQSKTAQVPALLDAVGKKLAKPPPPVDVEKSGASLGGDLQQTISDLAAAQKRSTDLEEEAQRRIARIAEIPTLVAKARTALEEAKNQLTGAALPPTDAPESVKAAHLQLQARQAELEQSEIALLEEQKYYGAATDLLVAQRADAAREIERLTVLRNAQQALFDKREKETAESVVTKLEAEVERLSNPKLSQIAKANADLANHWTGPKGLSSRKAQADRALQTVVDQRAKIGKQLNNTQTRVRLAEQSGIGGDESTGLLLRAERRGLPPIDLLRNELREGFKALTKSQLSEIKRQEVHSDSVDLTNTQENINRIAEELVGLPPKEQAGAKAIIGRLLETRAKLHRDLMADHEKYHQVLTEANAQRRELIEDVEKYLLFIDEHVLWIRSAAPFQFEDVKLEVDSYARLFSSPVWQSLGLGLAGDFRRNSALWLVAFAASALLLSQRRKHLAALEHAEKKVMKRTSRSIQPTAKAVFYTVMITLPLPLLLGFLATRLADVGGASEDVLNSVAGIRSGLAAAAINLAVFGFWKNVCRPHGLAGAHLGMNPNKALLIYRNLRWFLWVTIPLLFASKSVRSIAEKAEGRLLFVVAMIAVAVLASRLLSPAKSLARSGGSEPGALCYLCFGTGLLVPIGLALAALLGFYATAVEMQWRAVHSLWLLVTVIFITALIQRWLLMARKRLAMEQARKRRDAAAEKAAEKAAEEAAEEGRKVPPDAGVTPIEVAAELVDIPKAEDQTTQLLRAAAIVTLALGLWGIWNQILPALAAFDNVTLWPGSPEQSEAASATEDGSASGRNTGNGDAANLTLIPNPDSEPERGASSGAVTLKDLLGALFSLIFTFVAARNIPGLLELTILRRLDLKPGGNYAISTSVRYLIVVVGLVLAFGQIGFTWGKVQWIAAAVTVGIGFGLQEVFANFVAGLILLFERPIRLGDYITVGGVSGQVAQIRIRATTIRDFSNKELIVPNKTFITGELVNWTLTDSIIRVEIPVGVAYGSDTELVGALLERVGKAHPLVLDTPAPTAVFLGFGASSLDFELRVHIGGGDELARVRSQLHYAIDQAFRDNQIEIAFPQTDIHIRSMPETMAALTQAAPPAEPPA